MTSFTTQHRSVATLLGAATLMQSVARHVRRVAAGLDAWLERRGGGGGGHREWSPAREHELFDIGLARFELQRAGIAEPWVEDVPLGRARFAPRPGEQLLLASPPGGFYRGLVACGMFLHLGVIGAAALAAGLARVEEGASLASGVVLACCGGVLALTSCWRARVSLSRAEARNFEVEEYLLP